MYKLCNICLETKSLDLFYKKGKYYRSCCKDCHKQKVRDYKKCNSEEIKVSWNLYAEKNKQTIKVKRSKRYLKDKETGKAQKQNRNYNKIKRAARNRFRRANDPMFRLQQNLRSRLRSYLKNKKFIKNNNFESIVGCTLDFLKNYIESLFTEGMCWELVGPKIHIDHKIPLCTAKSVEELYKLSHYTNLQPLWKEDNLRKGSKITDL